MFKRFLGDRVIHGLSDGLSSGKGARRNAGEKRVQSLVDEIPGMDSQTLKNPDRNNEKTGTIGAGTAKEFRRKGYHKALHHSPSLREEYEWNLARTREYLAPADEGEHT